MAGALLPRDKLLRVTFRATPPVVRCRRFDKLHMGTLLMTKILIPLLSFSAAFLTAARPLRLPMRRVLLLVLVFSNIMALQFFFEVTSEGSWQTIGTSVSHFGIMNVQIVVVLLLFALAGVLVGRVGGVVPGQSARRISRCKLE